MTSTVSDILYVGAMTLDTLYQVDDFSIGPGKYLADRTICTASGMATTAATAAARLGGRAALWASVGDDANASALIAEISAEGVDCSHVRKVSGGRSANATIIVDKTGERWVIVDYDPITQAPPDAASTPSFGQYAAVMADVRWPSAAQLALSNAKKAGRYAILDADVASVEVLNRLASCATHIVASASGARILSGTSELARAARIMAGNFACFVCITDGAAGSLWTKPDSSMVGQIPSPSVDVVDTNGAGDVFHGAFSLAIVEGQSPEYAIRFASAAAALKCTVLGGRLGAPGRQKTLQFMNETSDEGG